MKRGLIGETDGRLGEMKDLGSLVLVYSSMELVQDQTLVVEFKRSIQ